MHAWLRFHHREPPSQRHDVQALLERAGITVAPDAEAPCGLGVFAFDAADAVATPDAIGAALRALAAAATPIALALGAPRLSSTLMWGLLGAGAIDLVTWPRTPPTADDLACRLRRRHEVQAVVDSPAVRDALAGRSAAWQAALRSVVEAAQHASTPVLICGDTGTGKEQLAHLVHDLDARAGRGAFVVLDCTTVAPELSGSEFFGHERGAFTGASSPRDGAFALAHRGTLFLDEVGELPLPLQAQLLRVVQERQFKRLGSNSWQDSDFRLVCATHRDLQSAVAEGRFRADLYHRIAGLRCTAPALAQRREDILPLVRHFLRLLDPAGEQVEIDPAVTELLLTRDYPGNVRDLRHLVTRLWQRHSGPGPITVGDLPEQERPVTTAPAWPGREFEHAIAHAVELGIGLKEIGQCAGELAVRLALEREGLNLHRAARRLGVTDRALQLRRRPRPAAT